MNRTRDQDATRSLRPVLSSSMTFEDRLDILKERHEALTQNVNLLAIETREMMSAISQDTQTIRALARIAEIHDQQ
jgi:acyl-CoA reductase-like NAD-dependent aldehyde dehydrogenase